jgi:hypothetical protein
MTSVTRYPDSTKKMSTPMKPPAISAMPEW